MLGGHRQDQVLAQAVICGRGCPLRTGTESGDPGPVQQRVAGVSERSGGGGSAQGGSPHRHSLGHRPRRPPTPSTEHGPGAPTRATPTHRPGVNARPGVHAGLPAFKVGMDPQKAVVQSTMITVKPASRGGSRPPRRSGNRGHADESAVSTNHVQTLHGAAPGAVGSADETQSRAHR